MWSKDGMQGSRHLTERTVAFASARIVTGSVWADRHQDPTVHGFSHFWR